MTAKSKTLLTILVATILLSGLVLWYFSAIRIYDLSLGRKYSYHLNYRNTAKSTIALPGVEAQTNSGDMNCEMKWDLVPLRIDEDIYTIAVFPAPAGECRFVFNDKDLLDDAAIS